uniref:Spondin-like TSP1 domain-containing protein n=2 Tax=Latimeria chalumnae TaxID=7897 RepID=H3A3L8_LATCH
HSNCRESEKPEKQRECFKVCDWHYDLFQWEVSEWGTCVLASFTANEVKQRTSECVTAQHGLQHRKVHCVQKSNKTIVADEICEFFTPPPTTDQACLIPCPQDCVVSEFSSWSVCTKGCGKILQHRTRAVIAPPLYGGSDCPNLTETRVCNFNISCSVGEDEYKYSLKIGPWSHCRLPHQNEVRLSGRTMLDFSANSEEKSIKLYVDSYPHHQIHHHRLKPWDIEIGYQTRQVRCTRSDGKNAMLSLCMQENAPMTFRSCVMPKDCETSDWSPWSACSKTCQSGNLSPGYRTRTRNIKHIAIGSGKECPPQEEKEACNLEGEHLPPCPRYMWKTTEWSDCQISPLLGQQDHQNSNHTALCGGGIQAREVYCMQNISETDGHKSKE